MAAGGKAWWRAWTEAAHDPKLQRLPPSLFKHWFNLCCLTAAHNGVLPTVRDCAHWVRQRPGATQKIIAQLVERGLFDAVGDTYAPHNWQGRQYVSDSSTERVKRFRKRERNVPRNAPEQSRAEQSVRGAPHGATHGYAFEQGIIKLNARDYERWKQAFVYLDLNAELIAMEPWAAQQANWFQACSALLGKHNAKAKIDRERTEKTNNQIGGFRYER
jgi:hypothetical protein